MKKATLLLAAVLVLAACSDDETTPTTDPAPTGQPVAIDSVDFVFLESYPVQVRAEVSGTLPTPCHETTVAQTGTDPATFEITAASTAEVCAQVIEQFELVLDVGSYETGTYEVVINGQAHDFTI